MTIDIKFDFSNGSCWCGNTRCHLLVRDGKIAIDESDGSYEWQKGKASDHRAYGQFFRGAKRLQRWSMAKFFSHLPEEVVRDYILSLVFLGDTRGRKSSSFWRLCKGLNGNVLADGVLADGYSHAVSIMR